MAYPDPLPSSGQLSLGQIKAWMVAAGEWPEDTTEFQYATSLDNAVTFSHLSDKTPPYQISDFYGYALAATYNTHFISIPSFGNSGDACGYGDDDNNVYTNVVHSTLSTLVQVFTDTSLSTTLEGGFYHYGTQWIDVDATGVIQDMGTC